MVKRSKRFGGSAARAVAAGEDPELPGGQECPEAGGGIERIPEVLDDGHRLVERLVGRVAETDESLLAGLSEDQRRSLDALLTQALDDLYRRFGSQSVTHVGLE